MKAAMQRKMDLPLQTRLAPINGIDEKTRVASLVWSTGAGVKRYDWERGRYYMEVLSLQPGHVRLERLNGGAPLLDTHNRYALSGVLGVVEPGSAKLRSGEGVADVRFSQREEVEPIFRDVKDKIIVNVSCGYAVHRMEETAEMVDGIPIYRAIDWEPMELSLVPIGADAHAGVRSDQTKTYPCEFQSLENRMPEQVIEEVPPKETSGSERHRVVQIMKICENKKLPPGFATRLIEEGKSLEAARAILLDELAAQSDAVMIRSAHAGSPTDWDAPEVRVRHMAEALGARFGLVRELSEPARPYAYMRCVDMAAACLELRGVRTSGLSPSSIIGRAMTHSTSDFPGLLGDAANRSLRRGYEAYAGGLKRIARKINAADFRTLYRIQVGSAPSLEKVLNGGEIKSGSFGEMKESFSIATYARIFGVTRQAIINDDLGGLTRTGERFGRAAAEREAQLFSAMFAENSGMGPTMATDSKTLFHADHSNVGTGVINVANLGAGVKTLRLQTDLDGTTPIDAAPRFLVVPAALETLARQYVTQITPAVSASVNPHTGLEVVVDPRLDATSALVWYLAADPAVVDTLEYAYLEGQEGVYIESRMGWEVDGVEFKARLDVGVGAIDWRGLFRSTGA